MPGIPGAQPGWPAAPSREVPPHLPPDARLCSSRYLPLQDARPLPRLPGGSVHMTLCLQNSALSPGGRPPLLDGWTGACSSFGRSRCPFIRITPCVYPTRYLPRRHGFGPAHSAQTGRCLPSLESARHSTRTWGLGHNSCSWGVGGVSAADPVEL